ncbi:YgfZ/GcvT domain-containing protein [Chenggangzhangella methanolivorans]|uniref:Folate-binding protein n=1 Tax=Chenggangzhangella methanolivorans TaxID=1437009 RepID=A0A9E6RB20_9HYPH|nr:folate-binding protein [Chenggangzhangella methanolivorans]QZO00912.1 folate-binding protein [Chenggangzhangella methanolivorans]
MRGAFLDGRGVLHVTGSDAGRFLDNLLTNDVGKLAAGRAAYAALLTPQGKIIADMLASRIEGGFRLDLAGHLAADIARRLTLYKLRSKVEIEDASDRFRTLVVWGDGQLLPRGGPDFVIDPRLPGLGARAYVAPGSAMPDGVADVGLERYREHRIALGVPMGGLDFVYGDAFPHEACLDQLNGIDFKKGCYVGQEVVSRMEHRGTARTRVTPVRIDGLPPEVGAAVLAGEKTVGRMGSSVEGRGLALIRLDRAAEAREAGQPLIAGAAMLTVEKAGWTRFPAPGETAA